MFENCMLRNLAVAVLVAVPSLALGQEPEPKIVIVPYPSDGVDAGAQQAPPPPPLAQPQPEPLPPPTSPTTPPPSDVPPQAEQPRERTIEALTPRAPVDTLQPQPPQPLPPEGPGAFVDGHPREGAFLSGPGSLTFILHHTIMGGFGVLATQMLPRITASYCITRTPVSGCSPGADHWTNQDARTAYLAGGLIGAAVGFGATAAWQFFNWTNTTTASFGIVHSVFGALAMFGFFDALKVDDVALSWLSLIGAEIGAWLTTFVAGGDMPVNHGLLTLSGGVWAMIYTALVVGIIASTGGMRNPATGQTDLRGGVDAILFSGALGAGAMALATLKFNPSVGQIMRANLFGGVAGAAVLVISALVLGANFNHPVPYILAGVAAIGAKTVVSLLWAEAAEQPQRGPPPPPGQTRLDFEDAPRAPKVIYW